MPVSDAKTLSEMELPTHSCWIEPGVLLKGGMMLLSGYTKVGKSFLALDLADCLIRGKPLYGIEEFQIPEPAQVLYADLELGMVGLVTRFADKYPAAHPASPCLKVVYDDPNLCPDDPLGVLALEKLIDDLKINVLILDPVTAFVSGNELDNSHIEAYFRGCRKLLARFSSQGLSMVFIHHFKKPPEEDRKSSWDEYCVKGAAKWVERPDTIVMCRKVKGKLDPHEKWLLETKWRCRHMEDKESIELAVRNDWTVRVSGKRAKVARVLETLI